MMKHRRSRQPRGTAVNFFEKFLLEFHLLNFQEIPSAMIGTTQGRVLCTCQPMDGALRRKKGFSNETD